MRILHGLIGVSVVGMLSACQETASRQAPAIDQTQVPSPAVSAPAPIAQAPSPSVVVASAPAAAALPVVAPIPPREPPPPTAAEKAQQRIAAILAAHPAGNERRARLMEEARRDLAEGVAGSDAAVLAARQAVDESGAGGAEHLLYARCLFEAGQHVSAQRELDATVPMLNDAGESAFAEFQRLESQLAAAFGGTADLARRLSALAQAATDTKVLQAKVERMAGGYRVHWVLTGPPRRLIGIWSDHEDLAPIAFQGTDRPMKGAWNAEFTWTSPEPPAGTIIVLALDETSGALRLAPTLKDLPVKAASDPRDRAAWAALIDALNTNPAAGGLVLHLPDDAVTP